MFSNLELPFSSPPHKLVELFLHIVTFGHVREDGRYFYIYVLCSKLPFIIVIYINASSHKGNSVVTDVQFGHLFVVCIKYVALQEVTSGLFSKISHCS